MGRKAMKSQSNFQSNQYIKNIDSKNKFIQGKKIILSKNMDQERKDRLKSWITFYRNNIGLFCIHYMGVKLFPYQRYWLTLIGKSTNFLGIASRASAKSWIIACYSIARCILYPGTIVALNSSTKAQAGLIISQHCQSLYNEHPNIQRETDNLICNNNKWEMTFINGSKINVVISGEGGRGHRSNVCVLEERRLIPTVIIDGIIRPFLVSRMPPYMKIPKYGHLEREEPQEIIISSAYFKSHDWWAEAKKLLKMIAADDPDVKAIFLDYLISLKHGIKTKKQLQKEKEKFDPITFMMEYGNIPFSSSQSSFYRIGFFDRSIKVGWRPIREDVNANKKNPYDIQRKEGERRLVSVDIAMRKGSSNDNTVITCARLFPTKKGWQTEITYIETANGKNALLQALRIKQIFHEFTNFTEGDILILDVANAGITIYDALTSITKDDSRGMEYAAMKVMSHYSIDQKVYEELSDRTLGTNAKECIYPISASQSLNSQIAISFRDRLKRKLFKFLVDDSEEEDFLIKTGNKDILDQEDTEIKAFLTSANVQTTLLINECISLETKVIGAGVVKLQEQGQSRKDRFTSCSYLNWYISFLDQELLKDDDGLSDEEAILAITQIR